MTMRPKILCIEDDHETVELLVEILGDEGFDVVVARDGREGVNRIGERPNLILCDVDMPHMSGFEVLQQLRKSQNQIRNIPFVFITAYGSRDSHLEARRLGADDFLNKPLDFELLVEIIRNRLAHGGRPDLPAVALTDREVETMTWVARGKSSNDIAVLISVSERTVNFHINNAIRKLGVATRVQAAIRCALLGLIDV
jgi:DNA-binding NarL/FixJ family response regulator